MSSTMYNYSALHCAYITEKKYNSLSFTICITVFQVTPVQEAFFSFFLSLRTQKLKFTPPTFLS